LFILKSWHYVEIYQPIQKKMDLQTPQPLTRRFVLAARKKILFPIFAFCFLVNPVLYGDIKSPVEARDLVVHELLSGDTSGRRIMAYPGLLDAGVEIPTWHQTALVTPGEGYVVFVDDFAYANFAHPCRYVFVEKETGRMESTLQTTPPRNLETWLEMETEAFRTLMNARNLRTPRAPVPAPPRTTSRGGEYYAVLMSGGYNMSNNHVRYWNDLSNIYITLVDVYGYKDENIIVLCSDGLDPTPDQSNGLNSHPDLDGDGDDDIMYSCVLSNIQLVFDQLAATLTLDDQLFIFTTDHGSSSSGWSVYLNLWNQESLTDAQLEVMMANLPQCNMITTMEQCFSGGFEDNISVDPGRVFSSACAYNEVSWAMPPDYVYDTYVFFWTAAVKGEDAYGNPCNADLNGDNLVSMHEAFLYAEEHDFSDETPQYNDTPQGLGDTLFLGPGPVLIFAFPNGLPQGLLPPGPATDLLVQIKDGLETYVPDSGLLHYRFDSDDPYSTLSLSSLGGDLYQVQLPPTRPGDEPEFYFSAQGDGGTTIHSPFNAPDEVYAFDLGFIELVWEDDFETSTGWTVESTNIQTGEWERADPAGTDAQPEDDHTEDGTHCFVTGRLGGSVGNDDVDGGPTQLLSPTLDLSQGDATIGFFLWFYHSDYGAQQPLEIHLSNNNGTTWTKVAQVTHKANWEPYSYRVSDFVTPTDQVKVRFTASDQPNDDVVEGLLDDFKVERYEINPSLWADAYTASVGLGCVVNLYLDAGPGFSNRPYFLVGTLTGTAPGITLPGGLNLPINWDAFTSLIMILTNTAIFQDFSGVLDGNGAAQAVFDSQGPMDPVLIGYQAHFAFLLNPPPAWDFVSNPIPVEFEP
jgi:hypothetical protein